MQKLVDSGFFPQLRQTSEMEFQKCLEFINRDMEGSQFVMWLTKDSNLKSGEVIVLFKDELFAKIRGKEKATLHNETIGMDQELKFERDYCVSLCRKDITSISVYRPPVCNCGKEEGPHQPDYFELEVSTAGQDYLTTISDRAIAYELCETIRDWMFQRGQFKKSFWQKLFS